MQLWLFFAALTLLSSMAGARLLKSSGNLHHAYQAQSWLSGRLHLAGTPPGYCDAKLRRKGVCKQARHDDWAVVTELVLKDGTRFRGQPCKTDACRELRRKGKELWLDLDGRIRELDRRQVESREPTWYVSFPPGPALFFLPFVGLFGVSILDVLLTAFIGALAPLLLLRALDRIRGEASPEHLWAAFAFLAASPFVFVASHGNVWFTAQTIACVAMLGYLGSAADADEPGRAGLWLSLALATRPHLAFACLWFFAEWRKSGSDLRALLRFAAPILVVGLGLALHNYLRFEKIFEFGHRFLDIRWQTRMQEQGQFSFDYLLRNLRCAFWLWPQLSSEAPFFKVSLHGSALWLGAPWLAALFFSGRELYRGRALSLWLCVLVVALPSLLYHNSGQRQFSYRFALDWLPMATVALAMHGAFLRRSVRALIIAGALYEAIGAWHFDRSPQKIFVVEPLGWPFEDEFK